MVLLSLFSCISEERLVFAAVTKILQISTNVCGPLTTCVHHGLSGILCQVDTAATTMNITAIVAAEREP